MRKLILLSLFLVGQLITYAQGERITNYHVDLEVQADRSLIVTETIAVIAEGRQIKRGITRSLPTKRILKEKSVKMNYDILSVKRDGKQEPYSIKGEANNKTLYIGRQSVTLPHGPYTYEIKYQLDNQIAFFDDYVELYWNAIGHDVQFYVDKASITVQLPAGIVRKQDAAYLGEYGSKDQSYTRELVAGNFEYVATRPLKPREGFSVAMGFEKGFFAEPSLFQKYGSLMAVVLGLLFLIPYYISTWMQYGRDPEAPAAYPIWDSPDGMSPASINYILHERTHKNAITASVIALAVKGYLVIEETESGMVFKTKNYTLRKLKPSDDSLPIEQERLMNSLFRTSNHISIDGEYNSSIKASYDAHSSNLSAQHKSRVWEGNNLHFLWIPVMITVLVALAAIFILIKSPYAEWVNYVTLAVFGVLALFMLFLYGYLIRQPTIDLLDLQSRIKGFKMYMDMAEKDRMNLLNPPGMTPEHFEEALPYAFALGVEHLWTKKFAKVFEEMNYVPDYYRGNNMIYFGSHFGRDFSSNMSATSTPPPPAGGSGSGGGGFSGGGGGGGGVGGW